MNSIIENPEDMMNADAVHNRAAAGYPYPEPDTRTGNLSFNQLSLCQLLGMQLFRLGRAAFDDGGELVEYDGFFDDMQLGLHVATMQPGECARARIAPMEVFTEAMGFFDRVGVKFGDNRYLHYRAVWLRMIKDALWNESEVVPPGEEDASEEDGEATENEANFSPSPGQPATSPGSPV